MKDLAHGTDLLWGTQRLPDSDRSGAHSMPARLPAIGRTSPGPDRSPLAVEMSTEHARPRTDGPSYLTPPRAPAPPRSTHPSPSSSSGAHRDLPSGRP